MCPGTTGDLLDCFTIFIPITQWYCCFYSRRRCSDNARATAGEGDDAQIAGACGCSVVRQFDSVRRECDQNNNRPTTDGGV